jgi:hypothetical protein
MFTIASISIKPIISTNVESLNKEIEDPTILGIEIFSA